MHAFMYVYNVYIYVCIMYMQYSLLIVFVFFVAIAIYDFIIIHFQTYGASKAIVFYAGDGGRALLDR